MIGASTCVRTDGILPPDAKLDKDSLPKIEMPNRDGFAPEREFQNITNSRMIGR